MTNDKLAATGAPLSAVPTEDAVVCRLRYPMRLTGLDEVMSGLKKLYGDGLVIVLSGEAWRQDYLTIARP